MSPDQQDNTTQEADKEDVSISDLFPSFDQALATFLHDSFDAPKESHCTLCEALIARQYRTWSDFLFIEDDIDALTYQEGGARVPLNRHVQIRLQQFVDFGRRLTAQGLDWEERDHYTKEAFRKYWRGIVKANRDSTANRVVVTTHAIPPDGPGRSIKPIDQLKYESWLRKPRAETTFPPVHSTSSTPAVNNSHPPAAYKTPAQPTVDNPEPPTGLPGSSHTGSTADSTSTGTYSYTWKYSPSTDSVRFRRIAYSSTPSIVPADTPTGDVPPKRNRDPHSTRARASYLSPATSRWTFYPQSETVAFHRARSAPQPSCNSSLQLPPSGASSKDSVVSSSVKKPLYGASFCPVGKPSTYSMTYDLPAVSITKRHRDALKINLYQLHATLLHANWLYDNVT
eukprot:jgi/Psemu1/53079/gm1.53079_g